MSKKSKPTEVDPRVKELREIAWIIHETSSIGDDEAAKSFDNMGEMWYNILMEAASKIVDLMVDGERIEGWAWQRGLKEKGKWVSGPTWQFSEADQGPTASPHRATVIIHG